MTGEPSYVESRGFGRWIECADGQGVRFGLRQRP
jgi:hypothetical protein